MPPPSSSDVNSDQCNRDVHGSSKKSAWRRPYSPSSNGRGTITIESNHVMGMADSWPALGESSTAKSDPIRMDSMPVPIVGSHHMKVNDQLPNPNCPKPTKLQTSGGSSSSTNPPVNGRHVSPQQIGHAQERSPGDLNNNRNNSNWDHSSNSRGNGFSSHRPFNRRGNNGSGGGTHNGGRRDPDRGSHSNDWNNPSPRHVPPPPPPPVHHPRLQFDRPPPPPPPPPPHAGAVPFIGPLPHARPFVGPPMGFPAEIPSPVFYLPAPPHFVTTHPMGHAIPPAMFLSPAEYQAQTAAVLKQIEYYFSNENLCKDMYLRKHMDEQGWVPVSLIAGFNRVKQCTQYIPNNINFILDSVRTSELVEVQDEKIRRRANWNIWILPSQSSSSSALHSKTVPSVNCVVDQMQNMQLQETTCSNRSGGQTLAEVSNEDRHDHLALDR